MEKKKEIVIEAKDIVVYADYEEGMTYTLEPDNFISANGSNIDFLGITISCSKVIDSYAKYIILYREDIVISFNSSYITNYVVKFSEQYADSLGSYLAYILVLNK